MIRILVLITYFPMLGTDMQSRSSIFFSSRHCASRMQVVTVIYALLVDPDYYLLCQWYGTFLDFC